MRRLWILIAVSAAALITTGAVLAGAQHAAPTVVTTQPNCRLGFASGTDPGRYPITDLARLDVGQWIAFTAGSNLAEPAGAEALQEIRFHQNKLCGAYNCPYILPYTYTMQPNGPSVAAIARARPGSLWLLGNEVDRRDWPEGRQDEMLPELYAQAYHDTRATILQADPTARMAIAGVIQATPLRLQYLDRVWNEYVRLYGTAMPIDVWNVHGFMYREKRYYPGCPDCYGADVPPGIDVSQGILYDIPDTISMTLFTQQIVAFRQWMAEKGQRDKPLMVSEYGALPWDYYSQGAAVNYVVTGTFAYMRDASDAAIGYPGDDNRLVQRWVVFSLDDTDYSTAIFENGVLSALGTEWIRYVNDPANGFNPRTPSLHFRTLGTSPAVLYSPDGRPVDATLYPQLDNRGNISTSFSVRLTDSQWPLDGLSQFGALDGCGTHATGSGVTFDSMLPGVHTVTVRVNSPYADLPSQVRLLVATHRTLLPAVAWGTRVITP